MPRPPVQRHAPGIGTSRAKANNSPAEPGLVGSGLVWRLPFLGRAVTLLWSGWAVAYPLLMPICDFLLTKKQIQSRYEGTSRWLFRPETRQLTRDNPGLLLSLFDGRV